MPELTDEHIEDLFADLRAGEISRVQPPGVAAARTTVRRRRTTTSITSGVAVLALVGGIAMVQSRAEPPAVFAGDPTAVRLAALEATARGALHRVVRADAVVEAAGALTDPTVHTDHRAAGRYLLFVACAGRGMVEVAAELSEASASTGGGRTALTSRSVSCAAAPEPPVIALDVPEKGVLSIRLAPDRQAAGNAGYAFKLVADRNPEESQGPEPSSTSVDNAALAEGALAADGASNPTTHTTEAESGSSDSTLSPAGDYLLRVVCVGPGRVTVTVRSLTTKADGTYDPGTGNVLALRTLRCGASGPVLRLPVTLPSPAGFDVTGKADRDARNKAGWSFDIGKA